jgi:hypothetical protein
MPLLILVPLWAAACLWIMYCYYALSEDGATYGGAVRRGFGLICLGFWHAVLLYLLITALFIAGLAACCVGAFFAGALVQVLVAVAYNDLSRSEPNVV